MTSLAEYYLRGPQWANLRRTVIEAERKSQKRRGLGKHETLSRNTVSRRV